MEHIKRSCALGKYVNGAVRPVDVHVRANMTNVYNVTGYYCKGELCNGANR